MQVTVQSYGACESEGFLQKSLFSAASVNSADGQDLQRGLSDEVYEPDAIIPLPPLPTPAPQCLELPVLDLAESDDDPEASIHAPLPPEQEKPHPAAVHTAGSSVRSLRSNKKQQRSTRTRQRKPLTNEQLLTVIK